MCNFIFPTKLDIIYFLEVCILLKSSIYLAPKVFFFLSLCFPKRKQVTIYYLKFGQLTIAKVYMLCLRNEIIYAYTQPAHWELKLPNPTYFPSIFTLLWDSTVSLAWLYYSKTLLPSPMAWLFTLGTSWKDPLTPLWNTINSLYPKILCISCLKILALMFPSVLDCGTFPQS